MKMTSKMQYRVNLSDDTTNKLLELERLWEVDRDEAVAAAIEIAYEDRHPLSKTQTDTASNLAISILQQSLQQGNAIHIPSLGITIEPVKKE